jgi:hypothetical protein
MATEHDKAARERMKTEPYSPITVGSVDERHSHALTYAAFYLGEINQHLGKIATELSALNLNGAKTTLELQGIIRAVASKT